MSRALANKLAKMKDTTDHKLKIFTGKSFRLQAEKDSLAFTWKITEGLCVPGFPVTELPHRYPACYTEASTWNLLIVPVGATKVSAFLEGEIHVSHSHESHSQCWKDAATIPLSYQVLIKLISESALRLGNFKVQFN